MTIEERREEGDQRKPPCYQGDYAIDCMYSAALWPLTLKNCTRFHPCFMYT